MVGLGRMGLPIARRLLAAGVALSGHDVQQAARDAFEASGGQIATVDDVVALDFDSVLMCLPTPAIALEWTARWSGGRIRGTRTVVADFTTSSPSQSQRTQADLAGVNIGYLDCPISGGEAGARSGSLVLVAGGTAGDFAQAEPLLAKVGNFVRHVGEPGSGSFLKAINQSVYLAYNYAFTQGLQLALAHGLPQDLVLDALTLGAAGHPLINQRLGRLEGAARSGPFTIGRALKDLQFLELDDGPGAAPQEAARLHRMLLAELSRAVDQGNGDADLFSLARNFQPQPTDPPTTSQD